MTATRGVAARLDVAPPETLFVLAAISQYLGAALAVAMFDYMGAAGVAWLRVVGAATVIVVARRSWRRHWTRPQVLAAAAFGTTLALMNLCFYLAIDELPLGTVVAIEFLGPIAVAAVGTRTLRNGFALAVATGGVVLLAEVQADGTSRGLVFALLAAVFWAGYIVLGDRVAKSGTAVDGLGVGMAIGALAIAPFGLPDLGPVADHWWLLAGGLAAGVLSNAVPYALDQVVLQRIDRARFALLLALLPATATVVGLVLLGQVPSVGEVIGIALVVMAVMLRSRETTALPA
ncbi:MAG: EamA family transporter [Acidimicrobiia bacterium]|nr:EamA family transporter [Acidimicrobiia bacterium]